MTRPSDTEAVTLTESERFWANVNKTDDCWLWTGTLNRDGYGMFGKVRAHRWAYEHVVGPIPDGLVSDHLCRVRHCVNPDHIEPVTIAENNRRGMGGTNLKNQETCRKGLHPWPESATNHADGYPRCRECARLATRRCREKARLTGGVKEDIAERFWANVEKSDDCWLWNGCIGKDGYGSFWSSKTDMAHRWAYENTVGPIPPGFVLTHRCSVRTCVNPDHLEPISLTESLRRRRKSNR